MTLNITLLSRNVIYQSADFRLTDLRTGKPWDFVSQKAIVVQKSGWTALVAFSGIGHTGKHDVAEWLATVASEIPDDAPFDELVDVLLKSDEWMQWLQFSHVRMRRHTFQIGAFVGVEPRAVLVSNYESFNGPARSTPLAKFEASYLTPRKPRVLFGGDTRGVDERDEYALLALLRRDPPADEMYRALAATNMGASQRTDTVSPGCFTAHVRITGEGAGRANGLTENISYLPKFALPLNMESTVRTLLREQGRVEPYRLVQMAFGRFEATEAFHGQQLKTKPNDPNVHSNYGLFFKM